uniref:Reverse transcriptase domain-containing protein n=1 Tax=Tanacetum cinerariifolium TaxID=118510 RepID=A0A6L2L9Y3_TANCI|nr:hypothetical protein [Tanacetum cinerariifolium]
MVEEGIMLGHKVSEAGLEVDKANIIVISKLPSPLISKLDKTRFVLDANLLRDALEITHVDQAYQSVLPSSGDAIMDFVNQLGYTEIIDFVSRMVMNNLYQPWRAILSMINQCLTGRHLGMIDPDTHPTKKGRKDKPHDIPYCRFTNIIICHLGRIHNIHQRSASPFHLAEEDFILDNECTILMLIWKWSQSMIGKLQPKWKERRRLRVPSNLSQSLLLKRPAPKPNPTKERPSKSSIAKPPKPKPAKEKSTKTTLLEQARRGKIVKVHKAKSSFQLVDEPDEEPAHSKPEPKLEHQEATRPLPVVEGKGKAIVTKEQAAHSLLALHTPKRRSTTDQFVLQRHNPVTEEASTRPSAQAQDDTSINIIRDSPSPADAETETSAASEKTNSGGDTEILQFDEEQGKGVEDQVNLEEKMNEIDQGQAGSNPIELSSHNLPLSRGTFKFIQDSLSSMKNLDDAYTIGDQFINDKSTEDEPGKLSAESELVSMVTIPIQQASFSIPLLSTLIIDLSPLKPASTTKTLIFTATTTTTTTNLPLPPLHHNKACQILKLGDLPHKIDEAICESMKEASGSYKSLPEHVALYEALEASMEWAHRNEFLAEKDKSCKRRRVDQDLPLPPPDSDLAPPSSFKQQSDPHAEQPVEDILIPDTANIFDLEDTYSAYLPKIKQRPEWLKPILDDEGLATPDLLRFPSSHIPNAEKNWANALATTYQAPAENSLLKKTRDTRTFMHWYCQYMGKTKIKECHKMITDQIDWANLEGDQVKIDISKPLPLSGPPGHVTIQTQFFFNHDLDNLRYGSQRSGQALSISKMKVARYLEYGLELLVHEHMWLNKVCTYDINASYGISHWWFNHQKFHIDRHIADASRKVVRTHMRILSVVCIKVFSRYGYDYLKEITLRKADYQEYKIAEKDFKILYPSDFEDLNLLLLQDFQLSTERYQKQLNLTKPRWVAKGFEYKHDYTIIDLPCAVVFPVDNNEQKIMRFNEIYKFSDGTLTNIMEALDFRVKEYKAIGLAWNALLVVAYEILTIDCFREPNEHFISAFRSKTYTGNPVKEILLKIESTLSHVGLHRIWSIKVKGTSRKMNNQAFTIKKSMSVPVQLSQAQASETPQVDDQILDLADDLKEAQVHISSSITSQLTKITTSKGIATTLKGNYTAGQAKIVKFYICLREGHMAKQCTQPNRTRSSTWFKEKLMLAEAQEAAFQTEDLDAYDTDCGDISSAKEVLMANLLSYDPDVLSKKLVVVTPMNKDKKVRFTEPVTSSSNNPKKTDSIKTKDFNKPLLTSTRVKPTTSASGSKPLGNRKNNRITRPPTSN